MFDRGYRALRERFRTPCEESRTVRINRAAGGAKMLAKAIPLNLAAGEPTSLRRRHTGNPRMQIMVATQSSGRPTVPEHAARFKNSYSKPPPHSLLREAPLG